MRRSNVRVATTEEMQHDIQRWKSLRLHPADQRDFLLTVSTRRTGATSGYFRREYP